MLCKWCANLVPKGRLYFCSPGCAFEVQIRRDAPFLRARTKERDRGVCAHCGIDTEQLKRILRHALRSLSDLLNDKWLNLYYFSRLMQSTFGYEVWSHVEAMCNWQADHVVEVVDGGTPYLENIQTLCLPCHKRKTKASHKERVVKRRAQNPPLGRLFND